MKETKEETTKRMMKELQTKNLLRRIQNTRDHDFIYLFKELYPEQFNETVKRYKERYGEQKPIWQIRKENKK